MNTSAVAWSAAGTENENEDTGVPVQPSHSLCFPVSRSLLGSLLTLSLSNQNLNSTGVQSYKLGDFSIV